MRNSSYISPTLFHIVLMVFVFASYAVLRIFNLSQAAQQVKSTADTTAYLRIATEPLLQSNFLAGSRPFVFPLVLKVFGNSDSRVVWSQGILSILSWGILAVSVAYSLHITFLRLVAFVMILLLSLYRYILAWDSVLLTESVSLSLMALFIAGWLWLMKGWHGLRAVFIAATAFLWVFSRDTNAWVLLMIAVFLLLLVALRYADKRYLTLSFAFIILFFMSNLSADLGGRWIFPFQNVLGRRILPNEQAVRFFAKCGMPVSPALLQLTGGFANSLDRAFYENPALEDYRLWLHRYGKICYIRWLLSSPLESVSTPLAQFNTLISMENIQPFLFSKRFSTILPARLEAILFPRQQLLLIFAVIGVVILMAILNGAWRKNKAWWVVVGLTVLLFPHYFIIWHGDAMGIYRHVLSASIQFYLGAWLLALFAVERVLSSKTIQETSVNKHFVSSIRQ